MWGTDKTYTFDDDVELATDWDVTKTVPDGGTGTCEITNSLNGFSLKNGNFLGLSYLNKSNIGITIVSKTSYSNITSISIDAIANDNSKPTIAAYIVTAEGDVEVFAAVGTKDGFATGGTNKWGNKTVNLGTAQTGKLKIVTVASSSGKYAALDNIKITYTAAPASVPGTVEFSPVSGSSVGAGSSINLSATGATSYKYKWTSNSDVPVGGWSEGASAVVPPYGSENTYLHAYGVNAIGDGTKSYATYTITQPQVATPSISPADGSSFSGASQTITLECATADATIHYTLDGTTPTASSDTYDSENKPVISSTTTVKAIAVKDDYVDSEVATATITKKIEAVIASWDFTNWSNATKTGVKADDTNWNQYEKKDNGGLDFGENGRSNKVAIEAGSSLKYSSTNISETDGLTFKTKNAFELGLIFELASTTLGEYHGSQYIWLYGSNTVITIPSVPANATIEIGVESHNSTDARYVTLKNGSTTLTMTQGASSGDAAKAYQVCKWTNTSTAGDITITPNKGLHIYYITVTVDVATVPVSTKAERNYGSYVTSEKLDFGSAEGITAYIATGLNGTGNAVVLQSVDVVPASTPIIVKTASQGATVNVPVSTADADDAIEDNLLVAGDGTTSFDAGTYYFLKQDQFYLATSGTLQTGKAYLQITGSLAPSVIRIVEGENTATSINDIESSDEAVKFIQNGQLYIKRNGVVYDAMGRIIR